MLKAPDLGSHHLFPLPPQLLHPCREESLWLWSSYHHHSTSHCPGFASLFPSAFSSLSTLNFSEQFASPGQIHPVYTALFFVCASITEQYFSFLPSLKRLRPWRYQQTKLKSQENVKQNFHRALCDRFPGGYIHTYMFLCNLYSGEGLDLFFVCWRRSSVFKLI